MNILDGATLIKDAKSINNQFKLVTAIFSLVKIMSYVLLSIALSATTKHFLCLFTTYDIIFMLLIFIYYSNII